MKIQLTQTQAFNLLPQRFNKISHRFNHTTNLLEAINIWDSMGYVDVSFSNNSLTSQIKVYDIYDIYHSKSAFHIGPLGYIWFNTAHMDNWTYEQRKKTAVYELGHALGLNEFNMSGNSNLLQDEDKITNIMVQGLMSFTDFGPCDRLVYYHKWRDDV